MQRIFSQPLEFNDGPGKLHVFTTGTVSVKQKFKNAKGGELGSKLNFFLDKTFTGELPIWVWLIEHPEGLFLVDTGENAHVNDADYFDKENFFSRWMNHTQFKFTVAPEEEVGPQLQRLGFAIDRVNKLVLTHMHIDHFDGLSYFEHNDILVHDYEWNNQSFPLRSLYPAWLKPRLFKTGDTGLPGLRTGKALTQAGDILMLHTPGHTLGHCSVLLKTKTTSYFLAGDATYDEAQLYNNALPGAHQNFKLALQSFNNIKAYARVNKTIYLPSHDPENIERIQKNDFLKV
jgi:N-acyl homoserine lactone hydrolase